MTSAENIAQCQDFEQAMKQLKGAGFEVRGDGMVPHVWKELKVNKTDFTEVFLAA